MVDENNIVIKVENVSKKFCRSLKHVMLYGVWDIGRNMIGLNSNSGKLRDGEFWALDNVSFELKRGETLGIIGANGSGKSTFLKLLNGIFMPDKGRIEIKGKVGALIEVGAGFHPMLTGKENIYVNGAILGMSKKEIDKKFDEIVDFADIGDFIDSPVKHYSSGMYVRLGFAIAVHSELDILLVDEVLAVGDIQFRMKCTDKIKEFQKIGKTIIYVTHEMITVKKLCHRCMWLNKGNIEKTGDPNEVVNECINYFKNMNLQKDIGIMSISDTIEIIKVWAEDTKGVEKEDFQFGETVVVRVQYNLLQKIDKMILGIALFTGDNICICALHTGLDGIVLKPKVGLNEMSIEYPKINLLSGSYYFDLGFFEDKAIAPFVYMNKICRINIRNPFCADGLLVLEHKWQKN